MKVELRTSRSATLFTAAFLHRENPRAAYLERRLAVDGDTSPGSLVAILADDFPAGVVVFARGLVGDDFDEARCPRGEEHRVQQGREEAATQ